MVVVVLMSLMASAALLSVRMPLANASQENAVIQIQAMDNMARQRASGGTPMDIWFDMNDGEISLNRSDSGFSVYSISVASPCKLFELKIGGQAKKTKGRVRFDRFGVTSNYAIKIGKSTEDARWIFFLGMTGQTYEFRQSDPRVEQLFEQERADSR